MPPDKAACRRLLKRPDKQLGQSQNQGHPQQHPPGKQDAPLSPAEERSRQQGHQPHKQGQHTQGQVQKQGGILPASGQFLSQGQSGHRPQQEPFPHLSGPPLPGETGQQRGTQPPAAQDAQGQKGVSVDHGQGPGHTAHPEKTAPLASIHPSVQQVQGREQRRPAKQGGPLGKHHVHQHIDPADVFPNQVGGCFVKSGEDPSEVFHTAPHKVEKTKPPRKGKKDPAQGRLAPAVCQNGEKSVQPKEHLGPGHPHGQLIGKPQGSTQQIQTGGDAVGQKGVGEPGSRQQGVIGRKVPLVCQAGDKTQVHAHVPIGGLAGVHRPVLPPERVPDQKAEKQPDPQHHPEKPPPPQSGTGFPKIKGGAPAQPQGCPAHQQSQHQGPQVGRRGKPQKEGQQHGKPLQGDAAPHAAQQQPHPRALPRQGRPGEAEAHPLKRAQIGQSQRGSPHSALHVLPSLGETIVPCPPGIVKPGDPAGFPKLPNRRRQGIITEKRGNGAWSAVTKPTIIWTWRRQ